MQNTTGTNVHQQRFMAAVRAGIISPSELTWRNGSIRLANTQLEKLMYLLKLIDDPLHDFYLKHPSVLDNLKAYPKEYDKLVYATEENILENLPWIDIRDFKKIKNAFFFRSPLFFLEGFDRAHSVTDWETYCELETKYRKQLFYFADNPYVAKFIMRPVYKDMGLSLILRVFIYKFLFRKISGKDYLR